MSTEQLISTWIAWLRGGNIRSVATAQTYRRHLDRALAKLGRDPVDITLDHLTEYLNDLADVERLLAPLAEAVPHRIHVVRADHQDQAEAHVEQSDYDTAWEQLQEALPLFYQFLVIFLGNSSKMGVFMGVLGPY